MKRHRIIILSNVRAAHCVDLEYEATHRPQASSRRLTTGTILCSH